MALAPCPACRRHVDVSGESCPFCGAACAGLVAKGAPLGRMSRKALALASSIAIVGCSSSDEGNNVPVYGAPVDAVSDVQQSDAPSEAASDSTAGDSGTVDTGAAEDSGSDVQDTGGPLPPYGLPPSDGG